MSFLVTALKWRPQKFVEVVGQNHISTTLKNAIQNNRIAHAYLFAGPRGVGKTTTARIFAKSINCLSPQQGEPCNTCEMCKIFNSSQSMDIIEIDGASNRRIEEIRTLRESVKYSPTKGRYKVYIIDEVHMLTTESFNALLKTLEEPPAHTIFIFATTDVHKVPLTIISRCQRFDFRRIELNTIKELLSKIAEEENIKIDDKSLTLIAKKADGALRDAESLFDQVVSFCGTNVDADELSKMLNLIDDEIYFDVSDAILQKKFDSAFEITNKIYENGWNFIDFVNGLNEHFRNILTVIIRKDSTLIESAEIYRERYLEYKDAFSEGDVLRILNFINRVSYEIKSASNQKLKLEISLAYLIGLEKSSTISSVLEHIRSDSFQKKKTNPINLEEKVQVKKEIKTIVEKSSEPNVLLGFKTIWDWLLEKISNDRPLFQSVLTNCSHTETDKKIIISAKSKDDYHIIMEEKNYLNSLLNQFEGPHKKLEIEGNIHSDDSIDNGIDSDLIKAIKTHLSGQERN
ncbi:MAG: DNA polymerase III subunit gamma/tau [Melioribacteraceae bacterium]|nr:DNA polymerase III subunit gamma/tau [Melioribacteraceae bacterium]MCO6474534.1 DNA polymerase III subunit gamma/tau [Melioribacteraceae bacterium]